MQKCNIVSFDGITSFEVAHQIQREYLEKRIRDEIPDTLLFFEHHPVITRGKGLQFTGEKRERHMPFSVDALKAHGISFFDIERGGDLTAHNPGQLVGYPIFKLTNHDISAFLRGLEQQIVQAVKNVFFEESIDKNKDAPEFHFVSNATGVWVGEKKIASIGIAVRKWVTYHGFALNAVNDLGVFQLISPCGFSSDIMTNLQLLWPKKISLENWAEIRKKLEAQF